MTTFDAFPFHDEYDILECRLTELASVPDLVHVIVEADVTHQDRPKPWYFLEEQERFAPWRDRIIYVQAKGLPTLAEDADPWAREIAQRLFIADGLGDAKPGDVLMQSDADEIPNPLVVRNLRLQPHSPVALHQRGHFWAVDWLYGPGWNGTVACLVGDIQTRNDLARMRNLRNQVHRIGEPTVPGMMPFGGWHLSWLGGRERVLKKVNSFCHPEVFDRIDAGIKDDDWFWRHGWHTDGVRMTPVEVDKTWPKWIHERRCPESWWRPR